MSAEWEDEARARANAQSLYLSTIRIRYGTYSRFKRWLFWRFDCTVEIAARHIAEDPRVIAAEADTLTALDALAAVRALHRPEMNGVGEHLCVACWDDGGWAMGYPCPTIRGIDRALDGHTTKEDK